MADRIGEGQLIVDSRIQIFLDTLNGVLPSLIREHFGIIRNMTT